MQNGKKQPINLKLEKKRRSHTHQATESQKEDDELTVHTQTHTYKCKIV